MSFVVDASVAAKWLVPENESDKAEDLLRRWQKRSFDLSAPQMILAEVANVLWKRSARGLLAANKAASLYSDFTRLKIPLEPNGNLVAAALELALHHRTSVYDGLYLALALDLGWDFVTADEKLYRAFAVSFPQVSLLRNWEP
jgi:predicted nucleic acid-binding protein